MRASSLSSVEQMGQTDVVLEEAFAEEDLTAEWQEGVFRAERPAERAMWRRGRGGSEKSLWWVVMKSVASWSQREAE